MKLKSAFLFLLWMLSNLASAHQLSAAYIDLDTAHDSAVAEIKLPLEELNSSVGIDTNRNGQLTWGEVTESKIVIKSFVNSSIVWKSADQNCQSSMTAPFKAQSIDGIAYLVMSMGINCGGNQPTAISYEAFFDHHEDHKVLFSILGSDNSSSLLIDRDNRSLQFSAGEQSVFTGFVDYVIEGVWHIWIGFDHILFLLVLLVSVVLTQKSGKWTAEESYREILLKSVLIISSFTVAHSITLTFGVLDIIRFNTQWVEVGIAISIVLAAMNNIWPLVTRVYLVTFALGLIHGFGFASVLSNLSQSRITEVVTLAGFNIGVELGQIAIVLVVLPIFYLLSRRNWYSRLGMQSFSLLAGGMGTYWAIMRIA